MPRKRRTVGASSSGKPPVQAHVPTNAHWIVKEDIKINSRLVSPGVEIKIKGEAGRYVFRRHVFNPANGKEWIDVFGGAKGQETIRSFRPERIATVHRTRKTRGAAA